MSRRSASSAVPGPTDALLRGVRIVPLPEVSTAVRRHPSTGHDGETPTDVLIRDGRITRVGPGPVPAGIPTYDGGGRWALPGLWDQHVHLSQWVLGRVRLDTSAAQDAAEACALVSAAVAELAPEEALQGFGHRSATWTQAPTVAALDAASGSHPVVLISGDAHHGWLNSRALALLGLPPRKDVVAEAEWFALFPRLFELPGVAQRLESAYAAVVAQAQARGIVGVGDMEFANGPALWPARVAGRPGAAPVDTLRVRAAVYPPHLDEVLAAGMRTGDLLPGCGLAEMGPLKIISDGSLNTRTAYCCEPFADADRTWESPRGVQNVPPAELESLLSRARAGGLEVALHAIGDQAVTDAVAAFETTGARGTVEHAQLMRWTDMPRMARLGIAASVQPAHLLDDREVTEQCWPDRADRCFPLRALRDAGVELRLGSDAPVAPLDPWLAMAAAVHRSGDAGPAWHPEQSLLPAEALAASTDGVRLEVGQPGDVVLVDRDPLAVPGESAEAAAALLETPVVATFVAGRCVYGG